MQGRGCWKKPGMVLRFRDIVRFGGTLRPVVLVPWASLRRNGNEAASASLSCGGEDSLEVASKVKADLAIFSLRLEKGKLER